jgi:hypothetical protein
MNPVIERDHRISNGVRGHGTGLGWLHNSGLLLVEGEGVDGLVVHVDLEV